MGELTAADFEFLGIIFLSYVIGSIPPAYLAGRVFGRVDLREKGSGNVGGANVYTSVGRWLVIPVGVAEVAKGAGAVLLARAADFDAGGQMMAGVFALIGHNWSIFLGLRGGRGTGVIIGVLLLLAPLQLGLFAASGILGLLLHVTPVGVLLGLALTPISALMSGQHISVFLGCSAILLVMVTKRILGNDAARWRSDWQVLLRRLFLDRDIASRREWLERSDTTRGFL
jgi:acyl phosphate:glycerol-3-phosphate acyltransferase